MNKVSQKAAQSLGTISVQLLQAWLIMLVLGVLSVNVGFVQVWFAVAVASIAAAVVAGVLAGLCGDGKS